MGNIRGNIISSRPSSSSSSLGFLLDLLLVSLSILTPPGRVSLSLNWVFLRIHLYSICLCASHINKRELRSKYCASRSLTYAHFIPTLFLAPPPGEGWASLKFNCVIYIWSNTYLFLITICFLNVNLVFKGLFTYFFYEKTL